MVWKRIEEEKGTSFIGDILLFLEARAPDFMNIVFTAMVFSKSRVRQA